jgi:flagellar assembly factor FliW
MDVSSRPLIVKFPLGLPGFEHHHRFTLTAQTSPVFLLESDGPLGVRFFAIPVSILEMTYQLDITAEVARVVGFAEDQAIGGNILALAILAVAPDGAVTANLLAPVIINLATGIAIQAIRSDAKYSHQHAVISSSDKEAECS